MVLRVQPARELTAGCAAGCGRCCDPVVLDYDTYAALMAHARSGEVTGPDAAFIAQHWHPVTASPGEDGSASLGLRCDAFDPATRMCTAREDRPPVCRDYPWYGENPAVSGRAASLYPECSYLADVPPPSRPEGARPLIPVTPVASAAVSSMAAGYPRYGG